MSFLRFTGIVSGANIASTTGIQGLEILTTGQGTFLYGVTGNGGGLASYAISGGQLASEVDLEVFAGSVELTEGTGATLVSENGSTYLLHNGTLGTSMGLTELNSDGTLGTTQTLYQQGVENPGAMTALDVANGFVIYAAYGEQREIGAFLADSGGIQGQGPGSNSLIQGVSDLETVTIGTNKYLFAASNTEHRVATLTVNSTTGEITETATMGADEGVGVAGISALAQAELNGTHYLLAASAISSTLTVFEIASDGTLTAVDHVLDTLTTRFGNASAIDVQTVGDRVYVMVGGGDDGVSYFTLLPNGQLVHLETMVASGSYAPGDTVAITSVQMGDEIQYFSGAETGSNIMQLSYDIAGLGGTLTAAAGGQTVTGSNDHELIFGQDGNDTLNGSGGRDMIFDGAGSDMLTGGNARDHFVLAADGAADTITDFEVGIDKIDLSAWHMLYHVDQLGYEMTWDGAILTYLDEVLIVKSRDFNPLSLAELFPGGFSGPQRPPLELATDEVVIYGTASDEVFNGATGNDWIDGAGGNDTLSGDTGDDQIFGGDGDDTIYGGRGHDSIDGGEGNDWIDSGHEDDTIWGGGQRDTIFAGKGNDTVYGGLGRDTVTLGDGDDVFYDDEQTGYQGGDWIKAGDGNDSIYGLGGDETIYGDDGSDLIYGGDGLDKIYGGSGRDNIYGGEGDDTVWGGDGRDVVYLDGGDDVFKDTDQTGYQGGDNVRGGAGHDSILARGGDDVLRGEDGNDYIEGGVGDDWIDGGAQVDTILAGAGNDTVYGGLGKDTIWLEDGDDVFWDDAQTGSKALDWISGGEGHDRIYGRGGDDTIYGDGGNDILEGGEGNDKIYGGDARDTIRGGDGNDSIWGGNGRDTVNMGDGNDVFKDSDQTGYQGGDNIDGGAGDDVFNLLGGDDVVTGGSGNDVFVFSAGGENDLIRDFEIGIDLIRFDIAGLTYNDLVITTSGADTLIDYGSGSIRLENIDIGLLSASVFDFS